MYSKTNSFADLGIVEKAKFNLIKSLEVMGISEYYAVHVFLFLEMSS